MKFEHLPEYIPKSEEIESLKNFFDTLPHRWLNQIEVEPKKQAKLKILMFSRVAKCLKFGTLSTEISQYVSIPGSPEIKTDSFT